MPYVKKLKRLTIKEKASILDKVKSGVSVKRICEEYDVNKSTVSRVLKKKNVIKQYIKNVETGPGKRQTLKQCEYPRMESALYKWFCKQRDRNVPISVDILKKQAQRLHEKIHKKPGIFHASNGWMSNFKKRHGIRHLKICGEKLSSNTISIQPFLTKFKQRIEELNLSADQIYNADESGLFFRQLPGTTLVRCNESKAPGRKISKERLTFLACTNASGSHKVKLFVIGKSQKPRCFKNFDHKPVVYKANKNAWMTFLLFENWFHQTFVPEVREFLEKQNLPKKALLLVDNAPCHPKDNELRSDDGMITLMCFPPNCTAILQPMDQNVINLTKRCYKKSLLAHLVSGKSSSLEKNIRDFNLKDAICLLANAWDELTADNISKCWNTLMNPNSEWNEEDDVPLSVIRENMHNDHEAIVSLVQLLDPNASATIEEVNEWVNESVINEQNESDIGDETSEDEVVMTDSVPPQKIKADTAINAFNTIIQWAEENEIMLSDILVLKKIKEKAVIKSVTCQKKQICITDMFKKH